MGVTCRFERGSGCPAVLVDQAAEDAMSPDWAFEGDDEGGIVDGWLLLTALVRPVVVEVKSRGVVFRGGRVIFCCC